MDTQARTSEPAVAGLVAGVATLVCGVLALPSDSDLFLVGIPLGFILAIGLGIASLTSIQRSGGARGGTRLAWWGMGLPVGAGCLGFVLLPAT